jgi:NHLM bacteriocin system ABC transporter peptidase/ATP-binding protein
MRVRTPTLLQLDALQCGAVSLAIVLAHYGRWVPVEALARACGVSRDGGRAGDLLRAARAHGLAAEGFRAEPAALRTLRMPVILHWNFSHFLVLEGFGSRGRVYLNDPETGPRTVTLDELDRSMTGVVLAMEPGPDFRPEGAPPRPFRSLARRAASARAGLGAALAAGVLLMAVELVAPAFPRVLVDQVLAGGASGWLLPLLAAMGVAAGAAAALTWVQGQGLLRLERALAVRSSREFLWHLLRLPISFFDRNHVSALGERVPLNGRVARFLYRDLAVNALGAVLAVFFLLLMVRYSVALTGAALAVLALDALALRAVARRRADAGARLLQEEMKLNGTALLGLRLIETLKATASESELFARWAAYQARVVNARQALTRATHLLEALPPLLAAVNAALVLGVGGTLVIRGEMTLGMLVAFQLLMAAFLAPAGRLLGVAGRMQTAEVDLRRLDDVLETAPALPDDPEEGDDGKAPAAQPLRGEVELRGIRFGFAPLEPPLIRDLHLHLAPGRRVALVGRTGSGKSTIARLAAGLYEPWSGAVLLDGTPRAALPRAAATDAVAVVDQEVFLFAGTVRENLALWNPRIAPDRIEAAARDACIHDEIVARGGYDARVEERGANWSGGQRQRLEIARALAQDPAVLVLDEATSALDPVTEARIDAALRRRGCTCLLVAHRLSTIRDADEILVVEGGEVVQRGRHETLSAGEGPYRTLLAAG